MTTGWRWMTTWWGAGLAIVTLLLARSLHRVIGKICRPREENRSGTLELLSGKDDAKFEIIAVPGLGAHPYHTWEAQKTPGPSAAECQTAQSPKAHLLKDLLAHDFPDAKIWNFAHESNWLIDAPVKTTAEIGKCLITEIKDKRSSPHLPIIFIGHSLGGIIIKQALCSIDSQEIVDDTSGILFLGTPHQGSSVSVAGALLAWITGFLGSDTTLLLSLKSNDQQLSTLAANFKQCIASSNKRRQENFRISSFYETKKTYLLGLSLGVMVSQNSAVVHDDAGESHSVETDHSGLNKCGGPTDALYTKLTDAVRHLKTPSLLEQADTWIRDKHYTADRLKIERLSGELLPMEQCYIKLAIVEQSGQDAGHSRKEGDTAPSPFSILARQKVETPDKTLQVELAALFNERKGRDDRPMHPRRILIRGRAGVGKTTLCKKIVHEFTKGTWAKWNELFDRLLWVPLRNLKLPERRKKAKYTFEHLFSHEFLLPTDGLNLARALSYALDTKSSKTLFLLDGLDELSQDLTGNGSMACFLAELLKRPNIIITSRPSAKAPPNLDLELETIGFGPDQVNEYIERSFTNPETGEIDQVKVHKVQSFLQERWLIQGLMRIPIQLDALCYTWEEFDPEIVPSTMTGMYNSIAQKLWKKDVVRLEKVKEGYAKDAHAAEIEGRATAEIALVECLAFNGLHNDIIDFAPVHRAGVVILYPLQDLSLDETLSRLSFLRASGTAANIKRQNYHFIHLTFQEYFAARYFVRQWKERGGQLQCLTFAGSKGTETNARSPAEFLRKQKYTARYDIFWRFVAGLLDGSGKAPDFITTIEEEPLDLLGPTHQRLVMYCLSEISTSLPMREALEQRLARWLLFECKFNKSAMLASEIEFPELALKSALLDESSDIERIILKSLASRSLIPRSIAKAVAARLDDKDRTVRRAAVEALSGQAALPKKVLTAVAARLDDEDRGVRLAAVKALGGRAALPDEVLTAVAARLEDEDRGVRWTAVKALGGRAALPDEVLTAVAARLNDKDGNVRRAAVEVLGGRAALPNKVLTVVAAGLDDKDWIVRWAAVEALGGRAALPDEVLTAVAARLDVKDEDVRRAAVEALGGQAALPNKVLTAVAARLDDKDRGVRRAAVEALGRRAALPDEVLTAVAARLDDNDRTVRTARLDDEDRDVRRAAVKALGGRATLPNEVLTAVAARLYDNDETVRRAAVETLGGQAALPKKVLTVVAARLDDKDWIVRWAAVEALGRQAALPDKVLTAVAARLDVKDEDVRRAAVEALGGQAALPNKVLTAVAARLDDKDRDVRWATVKALGGQAALPDEVLTAVAARLDDKDRDVRRATVDVLMYRHDKLCCSFLNGSHIPSLYKALLERSFDEQLSWYIAKDNSFVNIPDGITECFIDIQHSKVREWINGARPADYPSISGRESSSHN